VRSAKIAAIANISGKRMRFSTSHVAGNASMRRPIRRKRTISRSIARHIQNRGGNGAWPASASAAEVGVCADAGMCGSRSSPFIATIS